MLSPHYIYRHTKIFLGTLHQQMFIIPLTAGICCTCYTTEPGDWMSRVQSWAPTPPPPSQGVVVHSAPLPAPCLEPHAERHTLWHGGHFLDVLPSEGFDAWSKTGNKLIMLFMRSSEEWAGMCVGCSAALNGPLEEVSLSSLLGSRHSFSVPYPMSLCCWDKVLFVRPWLLARARTALKTRLDDGIFHLGPSCLCSLSPFGFTGNLPSTLTLAEWRGVYSRAWTTLLLLIKS